VDIAGENTRSWGRGEFVLFIFLRGSAIVARVSISGKRGAATGMLRVERLSLERLGLDSFVPWNGWTV